MSNQYRINQHPELVALLNDFRWLAARIHDALEDDDTSGRLVFALGCLAKKILDAFWQELYRVSPLHGGQRLTLQFADGEEPVVLIEGLRSDDDETDQDQTDLTALIAQLLN